MRFPLIGLRTKIFLVLVLLLSVGALFSAFWINQQLQIWFEEHVEFGLNDSIALVGTALEISKINPRDPGVDAFVKPLGDSSGTRWTVIDEAGVVWGDSAVARDGVPAMESHADRPEIKAAFDSGFGRKKRFSSTLGEDMLYVARSFDLEGGRVVIRAAVTLANFNDRVATIRKIVFVAGALGLALAVLVAGWTSQVVSGRLRSFADHVRGLAEDGVPSSLPIARADEIGAVARAVTRMSLDIDKTVTTLRAERDRLESTMDAMDAGIIALDDEMRVITLNRFARSLFNLGSSCEGAAIIEVIRVPEVHDFLRHSERKPHDEVSFDIGGAGIRSYSLKYTRRPDSSAGVLVLQDITKARELEGMRRDFVANVSHELRTPLSVVRANAETLLDGGIEDVNHALGFVEAIHRNAERLARLTTDLLDLSRIESGNYPIELQSILLRDFVNRVVHNLDDKVGNKSLSLEVTVPDDLGIFSDSQALEQILINLIDNAIKYTPEGGNIYVRAFEREERTRVEVEDDGPGVPPEHRARLFERFYRADAGRSRAMGGTGLGLAIVKHLLASMSGTIGMEPLEPRGAKFWFELPGEGRSESRDT